MRPYLSEPLRHSAELPEVVLNGREEEEVVLQPVGVEVWAGHLQGELVAGHGTGHG